MSWRYKEDIFVLWGGSLEKLLFQGKNVDRIRHSFTTRFVMLHSMSLNLIIPSPLCSLACSSQLGMLRHDYQISSIEEALEIQFSVSGSMTVLILNKYDSQRMHFHFNIILKNAFKYVQLLECGNCIY